MNLFSLYPWVVSVHQVVSLQVPIFLTKFENNIANYVLLYKLIFLFGETGIKILLFSTFLDASLKATHLLGYHNSRMSLRYASFVLP